MEIKYKVWDAIGRRTIEGAAIYDNGDHVGFPDKGWPESIYEQPNVAVGDDWLYLLDNFAIYMYTGLMDKHGRKIYEGDVLDVVDMDRNTWRVSGIRFGNGMWVYGPGLALNRINGASIVVGNIYENPELVEIWW